MGESEIKLRALEPEDADFMYEAESDTDAWKYSDYVAPLSREMLRQYALTYDADPLRSGQLRLIIENAGIPIGIADIFDISTRHLRAETGIYILPTHRGNGYATKALLKLADMCRIRLGLHQLTAIVSDNNPSATKAYLKAGFITVGHLPDRLRLTNSYESALYLSIIFK